MYHGGESKRKRNPKEKATIPSLLTFFYTYDILKRGFSKDIEEDDIYDVMRGFKSSKLGDQLEKQWLIEQSSGKPSVYHLLWACYGKFYLFWGVIQLCMKIAVALIQPRAIGRLLSYFTSSSKLTKGDAIFYAALLICLNVISSTYLHNYMLIINELGIRIRAALCSLIYRKSLKLSPSALSEITIGKIVTLFAKDVNSFDSAIIFLNDMWISVILLSLVSYLMFAQIGVATLAGVLFLVLIIPLQMYLGKLTSSLRIKASKVTDYRLQVTQESLSAIKIIKMYTWERFFGEKISKVRQEEITRIKYIYFAKATSLVMGGLVISVTLFIIVMTYTSLGNNFTAEKLFFIQSCLQILRSSVTISIPIGIAQTAELVASIRRIHKVLTAEEHIKTTTDDHTPQPIIQLDEVSVKIKETTIIHDINLKIQSGLNFITGRFGGGKSSLLKTILEDYPICHGKLNIQGKISYVSEEPWLFPASIKQNILFGQELDEERYQTILQICALNADFNTFEKGDNTIVDDRGVNLSKGQQARISLARAVYKDSDIYLLDDCLSSLDTQVQDSVFKECVKMFLKDKIVVMISHNEGQLKEADNVIIMENGTIKSCMKPSEIPDEEIGEIVREEEKQDEDDIIDKLAIDRDEEIDEESKLIETKPHQNIYHEEKKQGGVDFQVYWKYFRFGAGPVVLILILLLFVIAQVGTSASDKLVSSWANIQQNISECKVSNHTNATKYQELVDKSNRLLIFYTVAIVISTTLVLCRAYAHFTFTSRASVGLHKAMVTSVINATLQFFDLRYIGNILNRFSKDLGTIDENLPLVTYECLRLICTLSGIIILIATVNVWFLIPAAVVFVILFFIRKAYLPTGRSLKRLDAATRSPIIGHLNASLEGLTTIRAYGTEIILRNEFDKHQDLFTSTFHMMQCSSRAFVYSLDMLCNIFVASIIIRFLIFGKDTQAGNVGLAITQALMMTGLLQWGVKQWAELETQMTSVERVREYTDIATENRTGSVLDNWPSEGSITYKNVNLTYGHSKDYVLKDINFTIKPRAKVGIVGRTGAGKSSLVSTLFRLYQSEGTITIDGVDIKTLSLDFLRSSIAIIPQDPVLFTGTIRSNIDPTARHTDEEIWKAIYTAKLKELVPSLDYEITDGGSNFSSGQRQLLCLARAIVSKNKIIILDEATASMDPETDVLIYTTIQENFASYTVVTIAHRLHSVLHSDCVMVVDKGEIVEFDDPHVLLDNKNGVFYKMIKQANLLKS